MPTIEQHIAVRLTHRVRHQLVAHRTAINIEVLQVGLAAGKRRQAHPAPQMQAVTLDLDRQRLLQERRATHRRNPPGAGRGIAGFVQIEDAFAVVAQVERHIKTRQSQTLDHFLQVIEFGFFGLEEFTPRRGVEKQVAHFNRRAHRVRRWLNPRGHVAAFGFDLPRLLGATGARGQGQTGHRTDRSQRLAPKAQAHHPLKVFEVADLAGSVSRQRQRQVVTGNTAAVITHPQQLDPGLLDVNINALGTRVEAVFQQLFNHRGRAFNHFTRGNLVSQPRAKQFYAGAVHHLITHCLVTSSVAGMLKF